MLNLKGKRIFISGGAGVIGCELVKLLVEEGATVMVGDLVAIPDDYPTQVLYRRGDLNYITQWELDSFNPEIFFHLAATFERSTESYEHWEENFWHNTRLSNHLMSLMRNVPALKRVINASSYLIYDKGLYHFSNPQIKPVRLKETDPINPRNLTGLAKLSHEIELEFLSQFKNDKFTSISARIYRGYGKNSRDVISRWIRELLANKSISVYKEEGWFDYMYAGDTAKGLFKLVSLNDTGIVNLGTGRARQVKDILAILNQYFPGMKAEYADSEIPYEASEADTTLLKELTGWLPERYLEDVIPELIAFEKREKKLIGKMKILGNVLITSVSKKVPLIESVRTASRKISSDIMIYGGDLDEDCLGRYFLDTFWKMPPLTKLNPEALVQYCKDQNICLIIPTRDGELEYFSKIKEKLSASGIHVMVSDFSSIDRCLDKYRFSRENADEIFAIPSYLIADDCPFGKLVVKERYGSGSKSIAINVDKSTAIDHAKRLDNPIFQPYLEGSEISIDAYITYSGEIKGIVMRKREIVVNGESQVTSTFHDSALEDAFKLIILKLQLQGHIILQAIIDRNQLIHVIECNPRFGGASTLAIKAGLDSFYWAYLEAIQEPLSNYPYFPALQSIKQIRHPHDFIL